MSAATTTPATSRSHALSHMHARSAPSARSVPVSRRRRHISKTVSATKNLRAISLSLVQKLRSAPAGLPSTDIANQLANEAVAHVLGAQALISDADLLAIEKNIRRRLYDSLKVLVSIGAIRRSLSDKMLHWQGIAHLLPHPPSSSSPPPSPKLRHLSDSLKAVRARLDHKAPLLQQLLHQKVALERLCRRNRRLHRALPHNSKIYMPFVLIRTPYTTEISLESTPDTRAMSFTLSDNFEIVNDAGILDRLFCVHSPPPASTTSLPTPSLPTAPHPTPPHPTPPHPTPPSIPPAPVTPQPAHTPPPRPSRPACTVTRLTRVHAPLPLAIAPSQTHPTFNISLTPSTPTNTLTPTPTSTQTLTHTPTTPAPHGHVPIAPPPLTADDEPRTPTQTPPATITPDLTTPRATNPSLSTDVLLTSPKRVRLSSATSPFAKYTSGDKPPLSPGTPLMRRRTRRARRIESTASPSLPGCTSPSLALVSPRERLLSLGASPGWSPLVEVGAAWGKAPDVVEPDDASVSEMRAQRRLYGPDDAIKLEDDVHRSPLMTPGGWSKACAVLDGCDIAARQLFIE